MKWIGFGVGLWMLSVPLACGSDQGGLQDAGATLDVDFIDDAAELGGGLDEVSLCEDATVITTKASLITAIEAIPWGGLASYSSGPLPLSGDLRIQGTVSLNSLDLALPPTCDAGVSYCRQEVLFSNRDEVAGVNVSGETAPGGAKNITFADVTVRVRPVVVDTHPSPYVATPVVQILAPCGADCGQDRSCPSDRVCYGPSEYCRHCDNQTREICACFTFDGPQEDGTECWFAVSGDVLCQGECRDGTCEYTGTPGWAGCP